MYYVHDCHVVSREWISNYSCDKLALRRLTEPSAGNTVWPFGFVIQMCSVPQPARRLQHREEGGRVLPVSGVRAGHVLLLRHQHLHHRQRRRPLRQVRRQLHRGCPNPAVWRHTGPGNSHRLFHRAAEHQDRYNPHLCAPYVQKYCRKLRNFWNHTSVGIKMHL